MLPPAVVTIVLQLRQLGLAGTGPGMIAVYIGMYLSTAIFFVTGFIRTLPYELEEAARIDGAGSFRVFRIVLPLLRPVIATATIMVMLFVWSDVFYAFFVVGGADRHPAAEPLPGRQRRALPEQLAPDLRLRRP